MICHSYNTCISPNISQPLTSSPIIGTHNSTTSHSDMALVDWLRNLQIDDASIDRVSSLSIFGRKAVEQKLVTYYLFYI